MKDTLRALFARTYFIKYVLTAKGTTYNVTGWTLRYLWPWQNLVLNIKELRVAKLGEFENADTFDLVSVERV